MQLDVKRLLMLREVGRTGGILAAAQELGVTASAVSQQIAKLEADTGLPLVLRRSAARVTLTPAGLRLAARAESIAEQLALAASDVTEISGAGRAITVAGAPALVAALIAPAAGAGDAAVRIVENRDAPARQSQAVVLGNVDILVTTRDAAATEPEEGVEEAFLLDEPLRIIVPESWEEPADAAALAGLAWVDSPAATPGREALDALERASGIRVARAHEVSEPTAAIALVAAGLAGAIVPALAIAGSGSGIRVLDFGPGLLGSRRVVARYRTGFTTDVPEAAAVLDEVRRAAVSL